MQELKEYLMHVSAYFCDFIKGIVHPKMKISPRFTPPQGILGVSDIPLSDEHIRSYIWHCPACSNLYNGVNGAPVSESEKKVSIHHKTTPHGSWVLIKDMC